MSASTISKLDMIDRACDLAEQAIRRKDNARDAMAELVAIRKATADRRGYEQRPTKLLVLSGRGIRFGVPGHYGLFHETPTLEAAIAVARRNLAEGHACACVAIRIEAKLIDGIGDGTDQELVRFDVYPDRVALVPRGQGGLSDEQAAKVLALPKKGLL